MAFIEGGRQFGGGGGVDSVDGMLPVWEVFGYPISVFVFQPGHYYDFVAHLSWNWREVVQLAMAERILEGAA